MFWSSSPGQVLGSSVLNQMFAIRLVQLLGWVFENKERKKEIPVLQSYTSLVRVFQGAPMHWHEHPAQLETVVVSFPGWCVCLWFISPQFFQLIFFIPDWMDKLLPSQCEFCSWFEAKVGPVLEPNKNAQKLSFLSQFIALILSHPGSQLLQLLAQSLIGSPCNLLWQGTLTACCHQHF